MATIVAGYRALARGPGENVFLHMAPVVRRFPPVVGTRYTMPWIHWQVFLPGQKVAIAWGSALSHEGAESKAWKAYDAWIAGRRRWMEDDAPFTDDALRTDYHHLDPKWPRV
jgi:hypothetical protein